MASSRDSGTAWLLWALGFLGFCGMHRLYADKPVSGLIYLFTGGLCFVGQLIDIFLLPDMIRTRNLELQMAHQNRQLPPAQMAFNDPRLHAGYGAPAHVPAQPQAQSASRGRPLAYEEQLQVDLTRLAQQRGGTLTVSDGVAATGRPPKEIQEALDAMTRNGFVDMDLNPETGAIVYAFRSGGQS